MASSMYFKRDTMVKNRDSRNKEICTMFDMFDWHVFTWKIHNLSLIPHEVDYVVQSPLFYFGDASWILKMYLYGQRQFRTDGYMDIIIERLGSQTPISDELLCKMYWKNASNEEFDRKIMKFGFDSQWTYSRVHRYMQSPKESEQNDPFTLVFEFGMSGLLMNESDSHTKAAKSTIGQRGITNKKIRNAEIGEVFKEYLEFKTFKLKFYSLPSTYPIPAGYQAASPEFSFANALWILKAVPYYIEQSSERNIRVILERLQSKFPEQNVMINIVTHPADKITDTSVLFTPSHTEEEVIHFPNDSFLFYLNISIKIKNPAIESTTGCCSILRPSGVLQNFKNLFLSQEDSDILIRVKGLEFRAHKLVLKAQSPVFSATFRNDMQERTTGIIEIEDCDPSAFQDFLCFLYCGEVRNLSAKTAFNLFTIADKYNISDLRSVCMEFIKMNLSVDTFCDTITLALLHSESDPELIELSRDFLEKNLQENIVTDKWKSFAIQNPEISNQIKALVSDKNVNCCIH